MNRALGQVGQGIDRQVSAAGRMRSAMSSAFGAVSTMVTTASAAVTAFGASVLATGLSYNRLQQNANVALTTLMGDAEAAQGQMQRLNDFTSNSPFGRETFIQAQQQLLAFGVEAEKVIPYLDGIQNAVAGIGGSDQQISQITTSIAKIRSSAAFTQADLTELGNAGINAAALIAEATGQSEQEVRDSIFGNPLRGEEALAGLDALMEGMQARFAGTTDGIKQQMDGAADRVKAASRDIGSALAEPFIDPQGGGLAVTWGNQVADVLRALQGHAAPFADFMLAKANPAIQAFSQFLADARLSISGWDISDLESALARVSTLAPAVAGGLAGIAAVGASPLLQRVGIAINPIAAGLLAAVAASPRAREAIGGVVSALAPLVPAALRVATLMGSVFTVALEAAAEVLIALTPAIETGANAISGLPTPLLAAGTALLLFGSAMRTNMGASIWAGLVQGTTIASRAVRTFGDTMRVQTALASMGGQQIGRWGAATAAASSIASGAMRTAAGAVTGLGNAIKTAFMSNPIGIALTIAATAVAAFAMANADAEAKVQEHNAAAQQLRGTLDEVTGAATEASRVQVIDSLIADGVAARLEETGVALSDFVDAALEGAEATAELESKLAELAVSGMDASKVTQFEMAADSLGVTLEDLVLAAHNDAEALALVTEAAHESGMGLEFLQGTMQDISNISGVNGDMLDALQEQQAIVDLAQWQWEQYTSALEEANATGGQAAVDMYRLEAALGVVSDASRDASERLAALNDLIDILNGGGRSAAESAAALQQATNDIASAFEAANEATDGFGAGLVNSAGQIDTSTEAGSAFATSLYDIGEQMRLAGIAAHDQAIAMGDEAGAYDASLAAMQPYANELATIGEEAGLTQTQIAGLVAEYLGIPETVAMALVTPGADAAALQITDIVNKLNELPDGETTVSVGALTDDAIADLEDLGLKVTEVENEDGTVTFDVEAPDAETLDAALAQLDTERQINVVLAANTDDVNAELETLLGGFGTGETTITVGVDALTDDARAALEDLGYKITEVKDSDGTIVSFGVTAPDAEHVGQTLDALAEDRESNVDVGTTGVENAESDIDGVGSSAASLDGTGITLVFGEDGAGNVTLQIAGLSDQAEGVPDVHVSTTESGAGTVMERLGQIPRSIVTTVTTIYEEVFGGGGGNRAVWSPPASARGNLFDHTSGVVQAFANGGFLPGIYAGRTGGIHKFAEPETQWEAYISGKPGEEVRNRRILAEAAERLGMSVVEAGRDRATPVPLGGAGNGTAAESAPAGTTVNLTVNLTTTEPLDGAGADHVGNSILWRLKRAL
ncbi:MAG: tape measure protein [Pseudoclavibacter sp.]